MLLFSHCLYHGTYSIYRQSSQCDGWTQTYLCLRGTLSLGREDFSGMGVGQGRCKDTLSDSDGSAWRATNGRGAVEGARMQCSYPRPLCFCETKGNVGRLRTGEGCAKARVGTIHSSRQRRADRVPVFLRWQSACSSRTLRRRLCRPQGLEVPPSTNKTAGGGPAVTSSPPS